MRDAVIQKVKLDAYLEHLGQKVQRKGEKVMACCPLHDDKHPSMSVDVQRGLWKCFVCDVGGTVLDLHMRRRGLSFKDALNELAQSVGIRPEDHRETYTYKDQYGKERMRVDRIEQQGKKKFRQYRVEQGQEQNGVNGVTRTLYRLEQWHGKDEVALTEGEKCVHALEAMGWDATTNPGGSNGWLSAYSESLKGKHVEIWPDNDEPGEHWLEEVLASLEGKVAALRIVRVPKEYNDVADMVDAKGKDEATNTLLPIIEGIDWIERGVQLDLLSSAEMYALYRKSVTESKQHAVDLAKWLPTFNSVARPLMPGDLAVVLADTGVGKTAILANVAYSVRPLPVVFFELELSPEPMTERFIARDLGTETLDVETEVKKGKTHDVSGWDHVYTCPRSMITVEDMHTLIERSELKIGRKPGLVCVDYVGLVSGGRGKRYERMSSIAEGLKRLARATNTVVMIASQVRREEGRINVGLHDAKDSGSVENSAQLVLGACRPSDDRMNITVLKQTKMAGQKQIECIYEANKQRIRELIDEPSRD